MSKLTVPERVERIKVVLGVNQTELGRLSGASKAMVNHWISGQVKSIGATYAFALQRNTGFNAEWVLFGTGPERLVDVQVPALAAHDPQAANSAALYRSSSGELCANRRQSPLSQWVFHPASEADYESLPPAGKQFVKGAVALAIDEAKEIYGRAERKRSA